MDRVFRIRRFRSAGILMPDRFTEYMKDKRLLFDNERTFNRKVKQLSKYTENINTNSGFTRFAFIGEEFTNGIWVKTLSLPEEFEY